jgi:hypothetical protein
MNILEGIVVGVDESLHAEAALRWAAQHGALTSSRSRR